MKIDGTKKETQQAHADGGIQGKMPTVMTYLDLVLSIPPLIYGVRCIRKPRLLKWAFCTGMPRSCLYMQVVVIMVSVMLLLGETSVYQYLVGPKMDRLPVDLKSLWFVVCTVQMRPE